MIIKIFGGLICLYLLIVLVTTIATILKGGDDHQQCVTAVKQKYNLDDGKGIFWDAIPKDEKDCYSCMHTLDGDGLKKRDKQFDMQVIEHVHNPKKCALRECPSGYTNDALAGVCFKCEKNGEKGCPTMEAVWSPNACGTCGEIFGEKYPATGFDDQTIGSSETQRNKFKQAVPIMKKPKIDFGNIIVDNFNPVNWQKAFK